MEICSARHLPWFLPPVLVIFASVTVLIDRYTLFLFFLAILLQYSVLAKLMHVNY
jgi:hypothetical protein